MKIDWNADWALHPGALIAELLEENDWSRAELASKLGFSPIAVDELVEGRAAITPNTAERLERVLGYSAQFWLMLEENYQKDLVRLVELVSQERIPS